MTRTKKKPETEAPDASARQRKPALRPVRWINPTPNSVDIAWLEDNPAHALDSLMALFEGIHEGQRLSCKFDAKAPRWIAVLFDDRVDAHLPTPALSVRGATAIDALLLLAYYAVFVHPDDWQGMDGQLHDRFG